MHMAAREKVNKTHAVKEYLKAHPDVKNKEVAEALTKSGIKVSPNYVATIKGKIKVRHGRRRQAVRTAVAHHHVGIPEIKAAFALLKLTGGLKEANAALAAAQELREMVWFVGTVAVQDEASYFCDSCGEEIVIPLDPSAGSSQEYVEDCPVCCHPNAIHLEIDENGQARAWAESE
jgi:hypothetical protein